MIHQLRIYEIFEANKAAFHQRFSEHAMRIMPKYGFDLLAAWETQNAGRTEFIYLLAWPDESTMRDAWDRFKADAEWQEIKRVMRDQYGELVGEIEDLLLVPAGYLNLADRLIS